MSDLHRPVSRLVRDLGVTATDDPIPSILQNDGRYELLHDLPPSYWRHRRAIIEAMVKVADEAVAAERERCAKIAEGVVPPEEFQGESMARMLARGIYGSACKAVAEKIRSGQ